MMQGTKRPNGFMLAALVCVAIGLYLEFSEQWNAQAQVRTQAAQISLIPMGLDTLSPSLQKSDTPVVLFAYASWCGVCRQIQPYMIDAVKRDDKGRRFIFLSLDQKPELLKNYIARSGYANQYTPYILSNASTSQFATMIAQHGGKFEGGIPYIAIYEKGRITRESTQEGNVSLVEYLLGRNQS